MTTNSPHIPPATPARAQSSTRRVELLAFPDVQMLDVAGPAQVFTAANEVMQDRGAAPAYAVQVVAPAGTSVKAASGVSFGVVHLADDLAPPDTLIVAGGRGVMRAARDERLHAWLRERAGATRRLASVCTGAFLLAAAGLLDGRRAVTHWRHCAQLARDYPRVRVDPDPIFVRDGAVWTSAGVTAGIDLALALVEDDLGHAAALEVARNLVVFLKRPGGQAQFSEMLALQSTDAAFARLHDWMAGRLAEDLSLPRLALEAGMSERTFLRRYRDATGTTPARAVERLRIEAARQMLAATSLPVKRIAARCGFGSEETMRRCFLRRLGVSPSDYRARFGDGR